MLIIITVMTFITVFILVYLLLDTYVSTQGRIKMRLKALDGLTNSSAQVNEELSKPFIQRVMAPLSRELVGVLTRLTPKSVREKVEASLFMSGGFGGMGPDEFLLLCIFLAVSFPAIAVFLFSFSKISAVKLMLIGGVTAIIGAFLPLFLLNRKIQARKVSIQRELPDVLDLLTVSVEAGLGFDGALAKLSEKMKGSLVEEFTRVLQEIRIGVTRHDALRAMGARCHVADLSLFTTSLVQADQLGVSIGNVLRVQSVGMRDKRRQRAEEQAMKAPIKMMVPMVLFIFPTIFIVLLGPAIIRIFSTFGNR